MKFPITFKQKRKKACECLIFYMTEETQNSNPVPDMTDMEEVRKAIIALRTSSASVKSGMLVLVFSSAIKKST